MYIPHNFNCCYIFDTLGSDNIALGVSLALISLMLVSVSIVLMLFCVYHYKNIGQKSQHTSSMMDTKHDNLMMSSIETAVTDEEC